jgi:hypothetical protein
MSALIPFRGPALTRRLSIPIAAVGGAGTSASTGLHAATSGGFGSFMAAQGPVAFPIAVADFEEDIEEVEEEAMHDYVAGGSL